MVALAIAFTSFPLRVVRQGHLSQRTPFDIPLLILFIGMIVGVEVSEHFAISFGAFQTFLAMSAFYYSIVNYPFPAGLVNWRVGIAVLGQIMILALVARGAFGLHVYHLSIGFAIVAAMAAGIAIFNRRPLTQVISAVICSAMVWVVISTLGDYEAPHRLFSLQTVASRMLLWQDTLLLMGGSSTTWTGFGLGCWFFIFPPCSHWHPHSAYLQLYTDTGVIGIVAFICAVMVGAILFADIIRSPRKHPYYGFGIGVVLAIAIVALDGTIEIAPYAIPWFSDSHYGVHYYVLSPIPWLLAALLVTARRLLRQPPTGAGEKSKE